jgi:hypothetical protein
LNPNQSLSSTLNSHFPVTLLCSSIPNTFSSLQTPPSRLPAFPPPKWFLTCAAVSLLVSLSVPRSQNLSRLHHHRLPHLTSPLHDRHSSGFPHSTTPYPKLTDFPTFPNFPFSSAHFTASHSSAISTSLSPNNCAVFPKNGKGDDHRRRSILFCKTPSPNPDQYHCRRWDFRHPLF